MFSRFFGLQTYRQMKRAYRTIFGIRSAVGKPEEETWFNNFDRRISVYLSHICKFGNNSNVCNTFWTFLKYFPKFIVFIGEQHFLLHLWNVENISFQFMCERESLNHQSKTPLEFALFGKSFNSSSFFNFFFVGYRDREK